MEYYGVKCVGCGKEEGIQFYKVDLYNKEKKIGEGVIALCESCFIVFDKIKEEIVKRDVFDKFTNRIEKRPDST